MNAMALCPLRCLAAAVVAAPLVAQPVQVYSEFQRVDPAGNILAVDKAPRPREILSPAVIRNAYASFHVAVTVPRGKEFSVFLGQNPEGTLTPTVYKEVFVRRGEAWIPDGVKPLTISEEGMIEDSGEGVPGQTTSVYWLDLWVPAKTPVGRLRFEVQVHIGEEWVICPMEVRVLEPVLGSRALVASPLAAVEAPADGSAREALRSHLCGAGKREAVPPLTVRSLIRRNARQDVALAQSLAAKCGAEVLVRGLVRLTAPGVEQTAWCQAPSFPANQGAEWYLRVRDYLYRLAERDCAAEPAPKVTVTVTPLSKQP